MDSKIEMVIKLRSELFNKQEFIIPKPEQGEKEADYISRCMGAIGGEYDTQEQALAVCYSQLEKK